MFRLWRVNFLFNLGIHAPQMEEDLADARAVLENTWKQRQETSVKLEKAGISERFGTCTYYVSFPGLQVRR